MYYTATQKVPGGKLLRVKVEANDAICSLRIEGDFFLHPEDALPEIENSLSGLSVKASAAKMAELLQNALTATKSAFIGVSPADIADTILAAFEAAPIETAPPTEELKK